MLGTILWLSFLDFTSKSKVVLFVYNFKKISSEKIPPSTMSQTQGYHEECWSCVGLARGMCPREAFETFLNEDVTCFTDSEDTSTASTLTTNSQLTSTASSSKKPSVSQLYLTTEALKKVAISNLGKQNVVQSREA